MLVYQLLYKELHLYHGYFLSHNAFLMAVIAASKWCAEYFLPSVSWQAQGMLCTWHTSYTSHKNTPYISDTKIMKQNTITANMF
jgi:hypothetical protein